MAAQVNTAFPAKVLATPAHGKLAVTALSHYLLGSSLSLGTPTRSLLQNYFLRFGNFKCFLAVQLLSMGQVVVIQRLTLLVWPFVQISLAILLSTRLLGN